MKINFIAFFAIWSCVGVPSAPYSIDMTGSEILELLDPTDPKLPKSIADWRQRLAQKGEVFDTLLPFTQSPFVSSLIAPRVVMSHTAELYLAFIPRQEERYDLEFISFNRSKGAFDFGKGVDMGEAQARLELIPDSQLEKKCFSCHVSQGPIFSDRPWVNVTGANAPMGTILSFAILRKLVEHFPDEYGHLRKFTRNEIQLMDKDFGNLLPEPVIQLGKVQYLGHTLFQFRGSFELDANVRKSHMLVHTWQILKALSARERISFIKNLTEGALLNVAYPLDLSRSFDWNEFILSVVRKNSPLQTLPANRSPIFKDYQPLLENIELRESAGLSAAFILKDPVSAMIRLDEYVSEKHISPFPKDQNPEFGENFVEFKPAESSAATVALRLLTGVEPEEIHRLLEVLNEEKLPLPEALESIALLGFWNRTDFPRANELLAALYSTVNRPLEVEVYDQAPEDRMKARFTPEQVAGHRCLRCHDGGPHAQGKTFPFDLGQISEWERAFAEPRTRELAETWAAKAFQRMSNGLMPPEGEPEASGFEDDRDWHAILQYLGTKVRSR